MASSSGSSGASQPDGSTESLRLPELLDRGWKMFEAVDSSEEPLASTEVQARVRQAVSLLEEATLKAGQLQLFSRNEALEEVSTSDLKYLLLPALLAALTMKTCGLSRRLDTVRTARRYYIDYLQRCKDYNIARFHMPQARDALSGGPGDDDDEEEERAPPTRPVPCTSDLAAMAAQRNEKIERYRQKKELEARLLDVRKAMDGGQADDEVSREFYLLNVRRWITESLEEVTSIDQEIEILSKMDVLKHSAHKQPPPHARPPMKPFILTKDALQAQVFGPGYPSLPTMTVDDWFEQHKQRGALPDQGIPRRVGGAEDPDQTQREEEEKERLADNDDEESLLRARNWDDWKDTHHRGYGNRHNMG